MINKVVILIFGLFFLLSVIPVNALTAPTVENEFKADILFNLFILLLSIVFIVGGLYLKNNTFMIVGATGFLLLALFIMSSGLLIQSGSQVVEIITEYPNASVVGTCFNSTDYSFNETLNFTQLTINTVCPYSFEVTKSTEIATSSSWIRLPRIFEMALVMLLLLSSMYLLIMSFMPYIKK